MGEYNEKQSIRERIRWWLYDKCLAYCVRCVHPDADPAEFSLLDITEFVAVSKDELRELIEEAPDSAWRFEHQLNERSAV